MERLFNIFDWCMYQQAIQEPLEAWLVKKDHEDNTLIVRFSVYLHGNSTTYPEFVHKIESFNYATTKNNIFISETAMAKLEIALNNYLTKMT
jgi:hypothetical protein